MYRLVTIIFKDSDLAQRAKVLVFSARRCCRSPRQTWNFSLLKLFIYLIYWYKSLHRNLFIKFDRTVMSTFKELFLVFGIETAKLIINVLDHILSTCLGIKIFRKSCLWWKWLAELFKLSQIWCYCFSWHWSETEYFRGFVNYFLKRLQSAVAVTVDHEISVAINVRKK
jgi:hypothetical protein